MRKICERSKKIWRIWLLKDLEKLAPDRQREVEKTTTDDLVNTPKHTVHGTDPFHVGHRVFDMLCVKCQNADLSSDIRTRPIWINTSNLKHVQSKNSPGEFSSNSPLEQNTQNVEQANTPTRECV
jgi:hypothetical protein